MNCQYCSTFRLLFHERFSAALPWQRHLKGTTAVSTSARYTQLMAKGTIVPYVS